MSYILDALKKSEIENNPEFAATFLGAYQKQSRNRILVTLGGLVLLVNIAALGWWFYTQNELFSAQTKVAQTMPPATVIASAQTPTHVDAGTNPHQTPAREVSPPVTTKSPPGEPTVEPSTVEKVPTPAPEKFVQPKLRRIKLSALTGVDREKFPGLEFSTHIYAEDSDLRAVVVNSQRLQEGELIGNWELVEITETGVVIRFQNYLVEVPVLDSWDDF